MLQMYKKMMPCNKYAVSCNKSICWLSYFALVLQQKPKVGIANKHFKCYVRKLASKSANAHRNPSEVQQSV